MVTRYDGPGIYLYPAWGEPRPYLVLPATGRQSMLEFRDCNSAALLWTQSLALHAEFAGKVGGV